MCKNSEDHPLYICLKFKTLSVSDRVENHCICLKCDAVVTLENAKQETLFVQNCIINEFTYHSDKSQAPETKNNQNTDGSA